MTSTDPSDPAGRCECSSGVGEQPRRARCCSRPPHGAAPRRRRPGDRHRHAQRSTTSPDGAPRHPTAADRVDRLLGGTRAAPLRSSDTVQAPEQAVVVSASNVKASRPRPTPARSSTTRRSTPSWPRLDRQLAADVRTAVQAAKVPADSTLFGSVVSVGCETPSIAWTGSPPSTGSRLGRRCPSRGSSAWCPVTSVALFLVPTTS